jgi:hypothetical protein
VAEAWPLCVTIHDEGVYDMFGSNLPGRKAEGGFISRQAPYGQRLNSSMELPGALVQA